MEYIVLMYAHSCQAISKETWHTLMRKVWIAMPNVSQCKNVKFFSVPVEPKVVTKLHDTDIDIEVQTYFEVE